MVIKQKYGKKISWAVVNPTGNVAIESMGGETFGLVEEDQTFGI